MVYYNIAKKIRANIGKLVYKTICKHFSEENKYHKIINSLKLRVSFGVSKDVAQITFFQNTRKKLNDFFNNRNEENRNDLLNSRYNVDHNICMKYKCENTSLPL